MIDIEHQVTDVRRRVGARTLDAGEAHTVTISRTFDVDLADLWDACTNPERIPRWFLPVSGTLELGGRYQLEGNAGGTVQRCDPPHGFDATWEYGGDVSWIELRLAADPDGGTRFTLEHIAHVDDQRWAEFGPGAVGIGWDLMLVGLATHLATGAAVDRAEGEAWTTSDVGVRFMRTSNDSWYDAHVAAGADPTEARAAADRTIAAYTGA